MRRALVLLPPLTLATAQAQTGVLVEAYATLRPAICLLMGKKPNACPLPRDIAAPVSYENDLAPALAKAKEIHVIGRLAVLKDNVLRSLFARGLTPPVPTIPPSPCTRPRSKRIRPCWSHPADCPNNEHVEVVL